MAVGSGQASMPKADNTDIEDISEQPPNPDKSFITATLFKKTSPLQKFKDII